MIRTFGAALRTSYRPQQIYTDPLFLVLVNDKELDQQANRHQHQDVVAGWKQWAPNLTYWLGPGNHITVLNQPHVQVFAKRWLENKDEVNQPLELPLDQRLLFSDITPPLEDLGDEVVDGLLTDREDSVKPFDAGSSL
jgi:hypothetical protein